jgi:hypothetical protein
VYGRQERVVGHARGFRAGRNQYMNGMLALRCGRTTRAKLLEDRQCPPLPYESSQQLVDGMLVDCLKRLYSFST